MNGFEAAKQIREEFPDVKVVFFSVEHNPATIRAALSLRGNAYVKRQGAGQIWQRRSRPFSPNSPWPIVFLGSE